MNANIDYEKLEETIINLAEILGISEKDTAEVLFDGLVVNQHMDGKNWDDSIAEMLTLKE